MARRMPAPQNDPKQRGRRRSLNIDVDPSILQHELERQKQEDSTDEETNWVNIRRILRSIPRNNPNDPFKPHSEIAIHKLAQRSTQGQHPLLESEEKLLQYFGYDLDKCTIDDEPNPSVSRPPIPKECQYVMNQLPAWLRCFVEMKFKAINGKYGKKTPAFLRSLVKALEYQKTKHINLAGEPSGETEDVTNYMDFEDDYTFLGDEANQDEQELKRQNAGLKLDLDPFRPAPESTSNATGKERMGKQSTESKAMPEEKKDPLELWSPMLLQKAGDALRAALVAGASETEDEDFYEEGADEITYKKERKKGVVRLKDEEFIYRGAQWEAIVAEESNFHDEAEDIMNEEFMRPDVLRQHRREKQLKKDEQSKAERKTKREMKKAFQNAASVGHPLLKESGVNQRNAAIWRERGVGRLPSSLFFKSPCDGPILSVERSLHQSRSMEALRAYANWIANSTTFKLFIMIIIIGNAALLALETGESRNTYAYTFETLDSFFLSVYMAEFLLKFFAYPNQYFMSGFNVFDFVILVVSLVKSVSDWLNLGELEYLRFLTIIRALRILRGVSLSIHIQVLVRALLDTLKNHVVSVVLLLILLMYITSIVAYYLYGSVPGLDHLFGSFEVGMLRLFAFVTMDGWTSIMDSFADVGKLHDGRLFCLILIVLGNFLFSNIFIAIIIMQISDATDSFRKTRADERDIKVSRKQDEVFRRQKLDMRQLLARQRLGVADDFYELGSRFVKRLRHDDLTDSHEIIFSPLWMDSLYKSMQRAHHTSNILMNQHRKMADRLVRLGNLYDEDRLNIKGISRARYNRYCDLKSKLRLLKEQFLIMRNVKPKPKTRVKYRGPGLATLAKKVMPNISSHKHVNLASVLDVLAKLHAKSKRPSQPALDKPTDQEGVMQQPVGIESILEELNKTGKKEKSRKLFASSKPASQQGIDKPGDNVSDMLKPDGMQVNQPESVKSVPELSKMGKKVKSRKLHGKDTPTSKPILDKSPGQISDQLQLQPTGIEDGQAKSIPKVHKTGKKGKSRKVHGKETPISPNVLDKSPEPKGPITKPEKVQDSVPKSIPEIAKVKEKEENTPSVKKVVAKPSDEPVPPTKSDYHWMKRSESESKVHAGSRKKKKSKKQK